MTSLFFSLLLLAQSPERNVYVATEYGAVNDGQTLNDGVIEKIFSIIPPGQPSTVYFPSGTYLFSKPIFLNKNFIKLKGQSQETTAINNTDYGQLLYVNGTYPYQSHRIDCSGILDNSVDKNAKGITLGLDGKLADHFIMVQSYPPATGKNDYWSTTNALTINLKIEFIGGDGDIMGLGDRDAPAPFSIRHYFEPGLGFETIEVNFRTNNKANSVDSPRTFSFGNLSAYKGAVDICLQMAFDRDVNSDGLIDIDGWINSEQQPVFRSFGTRLLVPTINEPSFLPKDKLRFRRNKTDNFHIGNNKHHDASWQRPISRRPMMKIYGLYIGDGFEFTGNPMVRIDGKQLNDDYKFNGTERQNLIARLWLEQPEDNDRFVRFITGKKSGNTNIMGLMVSEQVSRVDGCSIEDLTLQTPFWGGAAISLGQIMQFSVKNCSILGGSHGIIAQWMGASYDTLIADSTIKGRDAWIFLNSFIVDIKRLGRTYVDGSALRFIGCDAQVDTLRTGSNGDLPTIECLAGSDYANVYIFRYINIDEEGTNSQPVIRVEKVPGGSTVYATDIGTGYQDGKTPFFELVDNFPTSTYVGSYGLDRVIGSKINSFTRIAPTWYPRWDRYPNRP